MGRRRDDRHGRAARADSDHQRRPSDGFRAAHRARFSDLVAAAVAELPAALSETVRDLEIVVADVPIVDESVLTSLRVPLAQMTAGQGRGRRRLVVYRRPLELRATSKADLIARTRAAIGEELAQAFGIDLDEDFFDEDDPPGR